MLTEVRHKVDLIKNNHVNYLLRWHIIREAKMVYSKYTLLSELKVPTS